MSPVGNAATADLLNVDYEHQGETLAYLFLCNVMERVFTDPTLIGGDLMCDAREGSADEAGDLHLRHADAFGDLGLRHILDEPQVEDTIEKSPLLTPPSATP